MYIKKFNNDSTVKKFQDGGQMVAEQAPVEQAPVEGGQPGGAEEQLAQVAQQLLSMLLQELGDPNAVAAVLQMAMEMLQQAAQGGGAPQEQPVFRRGGKIAKNKCGTKMKVKK
jgi:hypothetical protein